MIILLFKGGKDEHGAVKLEEEFLVEDGMQNMGVGGCSGSEDLEDGGLGTGSAGNEDGGLSTGRRRKRRLREDRRFGE